MSQDRAIFAELDAENLENLGLLGPGQSGGSKRVHRRRLNRSSEDEYRDISLQVNFNSPQAATAFATIPATLISLETLSYVGLSAGKANHIWSQWVNWPATGPGREVDPDTGGLQVTFIDFITARLDSYQDVHIDNDDQWRQCLDTCGMSTSAKDAIMDPTFKHIRLGNSCIFWVKDTIEMRYAGLEDIRRASRQREMELRGGTGYASGPSGSHAGGSGGALGRRGSMAQQSTGRGRAPSQGQRSGPPPQQQATPSSSMMFWDPTTALRDVKKSTHTVLFKGIDEGRIAGLFNNSGEIQDIQKLTSSPPSDFSGSRSLFYFTPDYNVAEYYAAYAKRRAVCESVVIVRLCIPNDAIDELEEPQIQQLFWPSPQWKQLVWRSKTNKSLPKPLRKYRDALLIIGSISKGATRVFELMGTWEDITTSCLLRIGTSNAAIQYVFSGEEEGREFIEENSEIKVFGFSDAALQRVVATYR
jgi:hypothetical protein